MLCGSSKTPPSGDGWAYEPKLDGYRCMVDTHSGFRARSRRGWAMAELVPGLEALPDGLQLDGELVSFDADGRAVGPPDAYARAARAGVLPWVRGLGR
jgi:ATP-dependent DNA ligase